MSPPCHYRITLPPPAVLRSPVALFSGFQHVPGLAGRSPGHITPVLASPALNLYHSLVSPVPCSPQFDPLAVYQKELEIKERARLLYEQSNSPTERFQRSVSQTVTPTHYNFNTATQHPEKFSSCADFKRSNSNNQNNAFLTLPILQDDPLDFPPPSSNKEIVSKTRLNQIL